MTTHGRTPAWRAALLILAWALPCLAPAAPESRRVLGLHDSKEEPDYQRHILYEGVEAVLDHLGLVLDYRDIRDGLPTHEAMRQYRGIVTWFFDASMADPVAYCKWLDEEGRQGRFVAAFDSFGAFYNDEQELVDVELIGSVFRGWQVEYGNNWLARMLNLEIARTAPGMFGFERPTKFFRADYDAFFPIKGARVEPLLEVESKALDLPRSVMAAIHPRGGYVFGAYAVHQDPVTLKQQWQLNPFAFLPRALRWQGAPRVDLTTLNGCRIFYSHIDGDGSLNLNRADKQRMTTEVIYDEILTKYDVPITVGAVVGEIETAADHSWIDKPERVVEIFKKIYRLDNVEPASHGWSHPMDWDKGLTGIANEGLSANPTTPGERAFALNSQYPNSMVFMVDREEWERQEIVGSVEYIRKNLIPENKRCELFQWTGDCVPTESALAVAAKAGLLNLNGGGARFDELLPSYTGVLPATRRAGPYLQVHASNENENTYTGFWTRNLSGYTHVTQTFANTGYPRRIKPINVYYHFYSGEDPASLKAVKSVYDYVAEEDVFPLFATEYVRLVANSREITLAREGKLWTWANARQCRTLRWDGLEAFPDLEHAKGVQGFYRDRKLNCVYLHLDGSGAGRIGFTDKPPAKPYLARATGFVSDWQLAEDRLSLVFEGKGVSWVEVGGLAKDQPYQCERLALGKDTMAEVAALVSDKNGVLKIAIDDPRFLKRQRLVVLLPAE